MSEPKAKAKAYRITKGRGGLSIIGFPFTITEAMLNDPKDGHKYVSMIERHEKDNGVSIFGTLIVLS